MKAKDLRKSFLNFFAEKGHSIIKSASVIPENDPTVLFTTAGMHPLVPYLIGEDHPEGDKLTNVQKCIRTGDVNEVGDDVHLTFFEMLGNWSLGSYFKEDAIKWSFEFLTSERYLNLPLDRLAFSVFEGDDDAPFDEESYNLWLDLGIKQARIAKLEKRHNWWGPAGQTGPCGPDSEMFYWAGELPAPATFDPENPLWVEIWNDVFMQYFKDESGKFIPLTQQNVDTGMGLERVTAVLQGKASCYDTELFTPLFDVLSGITKSVIATDNRSGRIIVDHLRAAVFMLGDGVVPGNVDQSYVLRRLIRRSMNEGRKLGLDNSFITEVAKVVIAEYGDFYTELQKLSKTILSELAQEVEQFSRALEKGVREFNKLVSAFPPHVKKKVISGRKAFFLYETFGFPFEMTKEMADEEGFIVDKDGFDKAYAKHQELSRKGAEQKFKGGLADQSEQSTKLHTATHLLHQALKTVLGDHVEQKGSNINADRLRFDFSHPTKMTPEEKKAVEDLVNKQIAKGFPISYENMTIEDARGVGAIGLFEDRYGAKVKVYSIGEFSKEICGGPHAKNSADLGHFKIKKEESSSRGVRRIKAILN